MRFFSLFLIIYIITVSAYSQNSFRVVVKDKHSSELLPGVNVIIIGSKFGASTNDDGFAEIKNIPDGIHQIKFSFIGYKEEIIRLEFPQKEEKIFEISLEEEAEEIEEISITSTRSSRLISDEPTRIEVIAGEEIDEKISMEPSGLSMLLSESTGIQVQQTSAASVNATFRIQGLDGRYTQLLRDGFPLYSGFSGSLSINQIPPLDLKQIEIIKGSSSTLYGGGAIAGLINLISKEPQPQQEVSFLINGTSALGFDLNGFYSQKFEDFGITFFASRNTQKAYDKNDDNFTDLPKIERYSVNPKLFLYLDENSTLSIGGSYVTEERIGGSIPLIEGRRDSVFTYTEKNESDRYSSQIKYELKLNRNEYFVIKNSIGYFKRNITLPDYIFNGNELSTFSEITYSINNDVEWIFGLNVISNEFKDKSLTQQKHNNSDIAYGGFLQNNVAFSDEIIFEGGVRTDYNRNYGWFALPRLSLLVKISDELTSRIGGGLGYKIPTIFTEDAEELAFRNVIPIVKEDLKAEKSYGLNFDINYRTILIDELTFSINQLFFYTRINDPITLSENDNNLFKFFSLEGHYDTRGIETNIKLTYDNYNLFLGYTYTDVRTHENDVEQEFPLTPKNKLGIVLIYEEHGNLRIGFEAYYTGRQKLSSGERATDYWTTGLMAEKKIGNFSLFINFENFLDTRQSNFGPMYIGNPSNPTFVEIYAPTDGRIINGGVKLRL